MVILMAKFIERLIECPFYMGEGDKFINCEGKMARCAHDCLITMPRN